ncbi:MAG: hypothetical protein LBT76_07685 [Tannerella sp.]|jgi:hypothetical protein|nr:hypothetical protein [Tannerella sp.]
MLVLSFPDAIRPCSARNGSPVETAGARWLLHPGTGSEKVFLPSCHLCRHERMRPAFGAGSAR